jgi:hypothetical protein
VYAGYVAYSLEDTLSVMVAIGAATAAVLVIGVRFFGLGVSTPPETVTDGGVDAESTAGADEPTEVER